MNHAIILAAGQSQRMKGSGDKLLACVVGRPVLYYVIAALNDHDRINSITIVANKTNREKITDIVKEYKFKKVKLITLGGESRQESLAKGMKALTLKLKPKKTDLVVVHNGANPLVSYNEITDAIESAEIYGASIVGHKIEDTVKKIKGKSITETLDREELFAAQTPQVINFEILKKALQNATKKNLKVTDESMLVEAVGGKVVVIQASKNNFKITTEEDLERLKVLLGDTGKDFRVGIGQDSHEFEREEGRQHKSGSGHLTSGHSELRRSESSHLKSRSTKENSLYDHKKGLTLAGVYLPAEPKLKANSDGDVVLHAIFNAISQAFGGESLGFYADDMCEKKGIKDSKKYIDVILEKINKENFEIGNIGLMIECKRPKIDPIANKLKKSLSEILELDIKKIGITSTSGENLTSFGLGLGIQCFAIVSLFEKKPVEKQQKKYAKSHATIKRKSKSKPRRSGSKK